MNNFYLLVLLFLFQISVSAQTTILNEPSIVTQLISKYTSQYKYAKKVDGWRIQFFSTADRRKMEETKIYMESKYPDEKVVWGFLDPYYHLKIGAFRSKYDAQALYSDIKKNYPGSFFIIDEIDPKELYFFDKQ